MKNWMRILCIVLVLLLFPVIPQPKAAATEENAKADFVILMDCSGSLAQNDKEKLCLEAFKNFMDMLPMEKARVTVIAFGYEGGKSYDFSNAEDDRIQVKNPDDKPLIHVIVSQCDLSDTDVKDQNKAAVIKVVEDTWIEKPGAHTPIGHALTAGVDMMLKSGAKDGNACFILVSDGVRTSNTAYEDASLVGKASEVAGEHKWPIYCIELNYSNGNTPEVQDAQKLLDGICKQSGNKKVGRQPCMNAEDVYKAYQEILHDFYGLEEPVYEVIELPGEYRFSTPLLASEATVSIWGSGLKKVTLTHNRTGKSWDIAKSVSNNEIVVVVEPGRYYSIKLLRPLSGEWTIAMDGEQYAKVLSSNVIMRDTKFDIAVTETGDANALTKTDSITVKTAFTYRNIAIKDEAAYMNIPATLVVECSDGTVQKYPMEATEDSYRVTLPLGEVPSGDFTVYVRADLTNTDSFKNEMVSERVTRTLENLETAWTGVKPDDQHAYVNGKLERIDLAEYFTNPDNDRIRYDVICTSNRDLKFAFTVDEANGYMDIDAGMKPGNYELMITAQDPNMKEPVACTFALEVENRDPEAVSEIGTIELWAKFFPVFQQRENETTRLDLDEYFWDPDGTVLTYEFAMAGSDGGFVTVERDEADQSVLHLYSQQVGDTVISVTAKDGYASISTEFEVRVEKAWVYFVKEWGTKGLIGLGILGALIFAVAFILGNMVVTGDWKVTVTTNGSTKCSMERISAQSTDAGKKKRSFALYNMLREIGCYMKGDSGLCSSFVNNFMSGRQVQTIKLKGLLGKSGCKVCGFTGKDQGDAEVTVYRNGILQDKPFTVISGDYFEVKIVLPDRRQLMIKMELL